MQILQLLLDNANRKRLPVNLSRNENEATLFIYDVIDPIFGVSALEVVDAISQAGDAKVLHIHFNSPGGDVFEGRAIMAAVSRFGGKTVAHVDSLCASAATSIALACNEVEMSDGAFFMIHNANSVIAGDKTALRERADLMEKIEGEIVRDYVTKTGKNAEQIIAWMDAVTWFTAEEAISNGFVDRLATTAKTKNTWNLASFANVPEALIKPEKPEEKAIQTSRSVANMNRLKLLQIV